MNDSFQKKIQLVLKKEGWSMAELGRRLGGISGQRIGHYISGKRNPKKDFFDKWEEVFGYELEAFDSVGEGKVATAYIELEDHIETLKSEVRFLQSENQFLRDSLKEALSKIPRSTSPLQK